MQQSQLGLIRLSFRLACKAATARKRADANLGASKVATARRRADANLRASKAAIASRKIGVVM